MQIHAMSVQEVLRTFNTDAEHGLSETEAAARQTTYGKNEMIRHAGTGWLRKFLAQFSDVMVIILLISAAVSYGAARLSGESSSADAIIILAIVLVNAVIGVLQESRAEHAIEALRRLSSPHAVVVRGGHRCTVDCTEVVPGDVVLLTAGDVVPADLRLTQTLDCRIEEASLTGEAEPSEKQAQKMCAPDAPLAERCTMAYASTSVVTGCAAGIAVATGMQTAVGHVAEMLANEKPPETPLQMRLNRTGKRLAGTVLFICGLIFIIGILRHHPAMEMLLLSVSLAVAAIPEGMTAVVTIVMALGVGRMARKQAIVRRLPAVETLGSTTVICSDKTGTLTQNRMTVVCVADAEQQIPLQSAQAAEILLPGALCTNCTFGANGEVNGAPTETALVRACGENLPAQTAKFPRVGEIPFTSFRKRMTVVLRTETGFRILCKGAPEAILSRCSHVLLHKTAVPLTQAQKNRIASLQQTMAAEALRVLAVAVRDVRTLPQNDDAIESNLTFCGLAAMEDPPRKEAAAAVSQCRKAGIRPVMITGDNGTTASAIARQVGIDANSPAVTGAMIDAMNPHELEECVQTHSVFARVSPEHKMRLVKAFRARGEVVAMTGDGVNDAPALRAADIGCAMGKSGTEVAKSAADMVLTDDNFATIVAAVREGRGVYQNICRTVHFLLSCNIGEILLIFTACLLNIPAPLSAIQLLWVNLVTDSFPALALGVEPICADVMEAPPVRGSRSVFSGGTGWAMAAEGCLIGALALLAYSVGRVFFDADPMAPQVGCTMAFAVLSLSQLVHTLNMRSEKSVFSIGLFSNKALVWACVFCTFLQVGVIAVAPLARIFHTAVLTAGQWGIVGGLSFVPLAVCEAEKALRRKK